MSRGETLAEVLAGLMEPSALGELGALAACLLLAWAAVRFTQRHAPRSIWFGEIGVDGVLFPLLALGLAVAASLMLGDVIPIAVFKIAIPVLACWAVIRLLTRVLRVAFPNSAPVRTLERVLSWAVWIGLVLWITDLLPVVLRQLEQLHWKIGGSDVSLRSMLEGTLTAVAALVLVLWLSSAIEAKLLAAKRVNLSLRKMAANATRALLLLIGLLFALSAAGIPLAALSVLGGAIGVGIGLGLQKLAANYVSGFVILAERSLRIGDVVKVDNFEGCITDITTRYTVVRAANGRESIVPNELLITQRIENCSLADPKVALLTTVQVAYGTDLSKLFPLLTATIQGVKRVLTDPAPGVQLSAFGADGLELTLVFWIGDMENGQGNVRSEVNLAVLRCLEEQGVEIPYPQRVLHHKGLPATEGKSQPLNQGAP